MKLLIQRVNKASVKIDNKEIAHIGKGLLIFIGLCKDDTEKMFDKVIKKILTLRIFHDKNNKMNKSILDINGEILIVSQFTLCATIKSGTRPSFSSALEPKKAKELYEKFVYMFNTKYPMVKTGKFGAYMQIELVNDGPVTFMLEFTRKL